MTVTIAGGSALAAATGLDTGPDGGWAGWAPFLVSLGLLLLVVPVQAAAEEYAFRGYLLQAVGAVLRRPWIPILVQAVLFAAIHGWGTPWGFADLVVFGALAGYLTVRTGGLEAAVALHVVNNLAAADVTAAVLPWQMVVIDVPVLVAYTLAVLWLARRRRIAVVSPAGPDPAVRLPSASSPGADLAHSR
jgi:membrane protease YdiL (CAAX protease family)